MQYLGHLPNSDMLYQYLKHDIQPQINSQPNVDYRVFKLNGSNDVYLYEEKYSGTKIVGKFFQSQREKNPADAYKKMFREHSYLNLMRGLGFAKSPHYIPKPLGYNEGLNHLLVTEFCHGEMFSDVITHTIQTHDDNALLSKLTSLAYFLSRFHNHTADAFCPVNFAGNIEYMNSLIAKLISCGLENNPQELYYLRDCWKNQPKMWQDVSVLAHGDATPANFMCGDGLSIIGLDLERLHRTDRIFDTGRIAGELAHFFLMQTGNRDGAEKFIGHFLWEYACHFPDREQAFATMNKRVPFYMGITFLRIARNKWLDWQYRKRLVGEGKICLREFQK